MEATEQGAGDGPLPSHVAAAMELLRDAAGSSLRTKFEELHRVRAGAGRTADPARRDSPRRQACACRVVERAPLPQFSHDLVATMQDLYAEYYGAQQLIQSLQHRLHTSEHGMRFPVNRT